MIALAFFGAVLVLMLAAAVFYDRRVRRRGLPPGPTRGDVALGEGMSDFPGGAGSGGVGGP
jgi:hypothetical protein